MISIAYCQISVTTDRHLQLFSNGRCLRRAVRGQVVIAASSRPGRFTRSPPEPASVLIRSRRSPWSKLNMRASCSTFADVGGFAAGEEVVARRREEIDHLAVFAEPCLMLHSSRHDTTSPWPQTRRSPPGRN